MASILPASAHAYPHFVPGSIPKTFTDHPLFLESLEIPLLQVDHRAAQTLEAGAVGHHMKPVGVASG